jgi:hypothetical protein
MNRIEALATREKRGNLRSATKESVSTGATPGREKFRNARYGLNPREPRDTLPTQLTVRTLRYLAEHPGASGTDVREALGIRHASQSWALLARLQREGLVVNERTGSSNAWVLSDDGKNVLAGLPEGMYVQ